MQGLIQNSLNCASKNDRYQNIPPCISSQLSSQVSRSSRSNHVKRTVSSPSNKIRKASNRSISQPKTRSDKKKIQINQLKDLEVNKPRLPIESGTGEKRTNRSMQTEAYEDLKEIYANGVIVYPSIDILKEIKDKKKQSKKNINGQGDSPKKIVETIDGKMQKLSK